MVIQTIHKICTILVLAIGVVHTAATVVFYNSLSEGAIWFAGAGLAGVFVALLNLALWPPEAPILSRRSAAAANFFFFFWLVAGVWANPATIQILVAGVGATMVISATSVARPKTA